MDNKDFDGMLCDKCHKNFPFVILNLAGKGSKGYCLECLLEEKEKYPELKSLFDFVENSGMDPAEFQQNINIMAKNNDFRRFLKMEAKDLENIDFGNMLNYMHNLRENPQAAMNELRRFADMYDINVSDNDDEVDIIKEIGMGRFNNYFSKAIDMIKAGQNLDPEKEIHFKARIVRESEMPQGEKAGKKGAQEDAVLEKLISAWASGKDISDLNILDNLSDEELEEEKEKLLRFYKDNPERYAAFQEIFEEEKPGETADKAEEEERIVYLGPPAEEIEVEEHDRGDELQNIEDALNKAIADLAALNVDIDYAYSEDDDDESDDYDDEAVQSFCDSASDDDDDDDDDHSKSRSDDDDEEFDDDNDIEYLDGSGAFDGPGGPGNIKDGADDDDDDDDEDDDEPEDEPVLDSYLQNLRREVSDSDFGIEEKFKHFKLMGEIARDYEDYINKNRDDLRERSRDAKKDKEHLVAGYALGEALQDEADALRRSLTPLESYKRSLEQWRKGRRQKKKKEEEEDSDWSEDPFMIFERRPDKKRRKSKENKDEKSVLRKLAEDKSNKKYDFSPELSYRDVGEKVADKYDDPDEQSVRSSKTLRDLAENLNDKAKRGELDPLIGRERELSRVIQILNRRNKNNPALIGEPGVGKTAIAEGLATAIVEGRVPIQLMNKVVYNLDMTAVLAGTQYRGQFEERLKMILDAAQEAGNVILVIDEMHNVIGAGESEGGALDAANILKPALSDGRIRFIGCTTLAEYSKFIEKDAAYERRFQKVIINEPDDNETYEILKGVGSFYEDYHHVKYDDDIYKAAVRLTNRYVPSRYQPDKALDLIDEAGAAHYAHDDERLRYAALIEEKMLLERELEKVFSHGKFADRDEENEDEHIRSKKFLFSLATAVEEEGDKEKVFERVSVPIYELGLADTIEEVAELSRETMQGYDEFKKHYDKVVAELEKIVADADEKDSYISEEDLASVIEIWTGIPVKSIRESENEKLRTLEERIHKQLVGQEDAVSSLAGALRRKRTGFGKTDKPSSFLFVGPTGVGKTQLAKVLTEILFDDPKNIIRLDMSEYMEANSVNKIIGSPPGYVGFDDKGQLTEKIKNKPYSVVLLDEIEKAHPDVINVLLQLLDEGRLTDSHGSTIDFSHCVIIMTSNAGTGFKANSIGFANDTHDALANRVDKALKETFKAEFINRIDDIIIFEELSKEQLRLIVDMMLEDARKELKRLGASMQLDDEVKDFLINKNYDVKLGARPLQRTIAKEIEDKLANLYLEGAIKEGVVIKVSVKDKELPAGSVEALKADIEGKDEVKYKELSFEVAEDKEA